MKALVMLTVCAAVAAAGSAQAQTNGQPPSETPDSMKGWTHKVDLSSILCKELPGLTKPQVEQMVIWLQGFYTEEHAPRVIDPDKINAGINKLHDYCKQNPEANLVAAGDDVIYEEGPKPPQPK